MGGWKDWKVDDGQSIAVKLGLLCNCNFGGISICS